MTGEYLNILIVEDEAAHAEAIRRALDASSLKTRIHVVATLREFNESVARNFPDIAIMDMNLPDGRAVDAFSNLPGGVDLPILLMTSYGNEHVAVEAIKSGAIDYIVKSPDAFAEMPRSLERALREWRLLAEHKKTQQEIRVSEQKFHSLTNQFNALLDTLPDRIVLQDTEHRVIWANKAVTNELGDRAIKSGEDYCYSLWAKRKAPCEHCPARESIRSGEPSFEIVTETDGKVWELRSIPVKESGRVVSIIEVGRDISEQRRLEEQLRQSQKMEAVGRLAGGVAHDFNNMLNVITGYTELALKRVLTDEKTRTYLSEVLDAANRSAALTRQLLAFSRKQVVEPRVMDMNQTIGAQMKLIGKLIGEDIQILFVPGNDLGSILMDPSQVDQILINLIVNARDAIEGPGRITISTGNFRMDEDYSRRHPGAIPGDYLRLTVSDTGCGMDAVTAERIFEPFYTTKEFGKGTGLGLATVYGIVNQNNGEIHVESEPGRGTTFFIHIPLLHSGKAEPQNDFTGRLPTGNEIILLVEDDDQNLAITRLLLEECGYTVISSASPVEACRLFEKQSAQVEMLLSDVVMPQMNGAELYDKVKRIKPDIKVLFMSGYTDDIIANRGVIPEGISFIHKPFTIKELAEKVRGVLDGIRHPGPS